LLKTRSPLQRSKCFCSDPSATAAIQVQTLQRSK
jgi:hypothetical protein